MNKKTPGIKGKPIDGNTRCIHYNSLLDIIAIKFKCCQEYYPCYQCHIETADHPAEKWSKAEQDQKAVLCGNCGTELTIKEYLDSGNKCPDCSALFNPKCSLHHPLYFEM
jgi:uncharacterized CHY-type Zn-finger protein